MSSGGTSVSSGIPVSAPATHTMSVQSSGASAAPGEGPSGTFAFSQRPEVRLHVSTVQGFVSRHSALSLHGVRPCPPAPPDPEEEELDAVVNTLSPGVNWSKFWVQPTYR